MKFEPSFFATLRLCTRASVRQQRPFLCVYTKVSPENFPIFDECVRTRIANVCVFWFSRGMFCSPVSKRINLLIDATRESNFPNDWNKENFLIMFKIPENKCESGVK